MHYRLHPCLKCRVEFNENLYSLYNYIIVLDKKPDSLERLLCCFAVFEHMGYKSMFGRYLAASNLAYQTPDISFICYWRI